MTCWSIEAKANDVAEVMIYDVIGESMWEDSTDAKTLVAALGKIKAKQINLRLNSPGGSVFDGQAILNALQRHPANVTTYIDGLAASIASIVALAGDKIIMAKNSMMMIHNPSSGAWGSAEELRKTAEMLDKLRATMIAQYAERTGQTAEAVAEACDAETWFDPQEAIDWGLADEIGNEGKATAAWTGRALEVFRNVPAAAASLLEPRSVKRPTTNQRQEDTMNERLLAMRDTLGLADDATEDEILAAAAEALDADAGGDEDDNDDDGDDAGREDEDGQDDASGDDSSSDAPATRVVDADALAQLQADAAMGRKAREQQITAERKLVVRAAAKEGRIAPAQEKAYLMQLNQGGTVEASARTLLTADPDKGGLAPGTVPVGPAIGQLGENGSEATTPTAYDAGLFPEIAGKKAALAARNGAVPTIVMEA